MRYSRFLFSSVAAAPAMLLSSPAHAQTVTLDPPPIRLPLDDQSVDLATGRFVPPSTSLSIGNGESRLVHTGVVVGKTWRHNYALFVKGNTASSVTVSIGNMARTFTLSGGVWSSDQGEGESLVVTTASYVLTMQDGTEITFNKALGSAFYYGLVAAVGTQVKQPDGTVLTLTYKTGSYIKEIKPGFYKSVDAVRLQSVNASTGYQLKFTYGTDYMYDEFDADSWLTVARVTAINNAVEYCAPTADSCALSVAWPYLTYGQAISGTDRLHTVTDVAGRATRFRVDNLNRVTGIKQPSESADGLAIAYDGNQRVSTITHDGTYTRTYTWTVGSGTLTAVSSDTLGRTRTTVADTTKHVVLSDKNAFNQTTNYVADVKGRITSVTAPEGNQAVYVYDARGNTTCSMQVAKSATGTQTCSGPSTPLKIVTLATYPASCTSPYTLFNCNKPTSMTDARGNVSNYAWNPTHGKLDTVTLPADANGVRPETRYTNTGNYARYLTGPGTWATSAAPVYRTTSISSCRVAAVGSPASCVGGADERVTAIAFPSSSTPNNIQPANVTQRNGNSSLSSTASLAYDNYGQLSTVDGPLSGTDDKTQIRYDNVGQVVGRIGVDIDGSGGNPRLAERLTYNVDGQVTAVEKGTVADLTDPAWASFNPVEKSVSTYDTFGRVSTQAQVATSGTTQYSLTQYSYDIAGRQECIAQRMNAPLTTTSLPASACTLMTAGAYGEDRISKSEYNAVDQVVKAWEGVGTADQLANEAGYDTASNKNGALVWVEDGKDNRTSFEYDGFDRRLKVAFPSPTVPGASNAGDFQQFGYDPNGNVTSFITRAGETLNMGYDNLNRLTLKDVPYRASMPTHTRDVYFGYDLFGDMTYTRFDNANGEGITNAFNALGQLTGTTNTMDGFSRTLSYTYDEAGNLRRLMHPDGNFIDYYQTGSGAFYVAYLNAASPLFYPVRDTAGRTSVLYRWIGSWWIPTTFSYDAVSRLTGQSHTFIASAYDTSTSLAYNPASQIASRTSSNDMYAFTGNVAVNRPYTTNGLNQYTAAGSASFGYDANGNLTSDGTNTYTYDVENRLVSRSGGGTVGTMRYDPLGRLYETTAGNPTQATRFLYDGDDLVAEYTDGGTLLRRYVHGPGAGDDPLVWFEGSSVADSARKYLFADERGSIFGVTDSGGGNLAPNTYDEYGIPGAGNTGRFQYTGQAWIPEMGMYYYKARMYSPTLGRFMQTDPIGYGDGMNMYAYVHSDPVNGVDPDGLRQPRVFCYWASDSVPSSNGSITVSRVQNCNWIPDRSRGPGDAKDLPSPGVAAKPQNGRGTRRHETKRLPRCLQDFLEGRIASDPGNIVLHDWSPFGSNSVTFDNDIYLTSGTFDSGHARHKFHEIAHTSQYARGYGVSHHIMGYAATSSHDNAPLEMDADDFAETTYNDYVAQGLNKSCPF